MLNALLWLPKREKLQQLYRTDTTGGEEGQLENRKREKRKWII